MSHASTSQTRRKLMVGVTSELSAILLRGQLRFFRENGFDVVFVSSSGPNADLVAAEDGVRHVPVEMAREISIHRDIKAFLRIVKIIVKERPLIINAGTPKAGLLMSVAAWLCGVPCRVFTLRGLRSAGMQGIGRWIVRLTELLSALCAHRVICISPSLRQEAVSSGVVPSKKAVVIGAGSSNGIDLQRFRETDENRKRAAELRTKVGIEAEAIVLGFLGRVTRDKGLEELARAWSDVREKHPEVVLLIVGGIEDPDLGWLNMFEADDRVHILGHVSDPVPYYLVIDVLVLPSHREGFGNVLIEASALGKPAVATDVTGCRDAVENGFSGILVPPKDAEALSAAISAYVTNPMLRRSHGSNGRARVREHFDRNVVWLGLLEEYNRLIEMKVGKAVGATELTQDSSMPASIDG